MKAQDIIKTIEESISDLTARVTAPVLDGTPFILVTQVNGIECWYGSPGKKPAAFHSEVNYGNHLCGTHQFSEESAKRNIEHLAKNHKITAQAVHSRTLLMRRLESAKALLKQFQALA